MTKVQLLILMIFILGLSVTYASNNDGCPDTHFLTCVTRLRIQRVPFDQNMLNVVFNITSEAKLRQTCVAYSDVLPCFRDRILQCGNEKQKQLLNEVAKMIMFFCSPFSVKRQESFLKHGECIGKVLQMPATTDCYTQAHPESAKIEQCRSVCYEKREFLCMMKIWVSEQNFCTLLDVEKNCNADGAEFYRQLQLNVFSDTFPIICDYNSTLTGTTPSNVVGSPMDPVEFFENAKKAMNNVSTNFQQTNASLPTLPPSIPVPYTGTRATPAAPFVMPTYIPTFYSMNGSELANWTYSTLFPPIQVSYATYPPPVQTSSNHFVTPSQYVEPPPNLWQNGREKDTKVNQVLPNQAQDSADWKPWYLGGSTTASTEDTDQRQLSVSPVRRLLVTDDKESMWKKLKNNYFFDFGQRVLQGSNGNVATRKDADSSYRQTGWPYPNDAHKVGLLNLSLLISIAMAVVVRNYL